MGVHVLTLALVAIGTRWMLTRQQAESVTVVQPDHKTTLSKRTTPPNTKSATSLLAEDVPGKDVLDLSRYPGSVRVEYEHEEQDLLRFTRARYLSHARVDIIRAFYRGVFRAEEWKVANVEFSEGEWMFLVVQGEREAEVWIEAHRRGVTTVLIESSEPLPENEPALKKTPQKRAASSATEELAPLSIRDTDSCSSAGESSRRLRRRCGRPWRRRGGDD